MLEETGGFLQAACLTAEALQDTSRWFLRHGSSPPSASLEDASTPRVKPGGLLGGLRGLSRRAAVANRGAPSDMPRCKRRDTPFAWTAVTHHCQPPSRCGPRRTPSRPAALQRPPRRWRVADAGRPGVALRSAPPVSGTAA